MIAEAGLMASERRFGTADSAAVGPRAQRGRVPISPLRSPPRRRAGLIGCALALLLSACSRDDAPRGASGPDGSSAAPAADVQPAPTTEKSAASGTRSTAADSTRIAEREVIPRESHQWTRAQATEKLRDPALRVAAAVRLARLGGFSSPALPEPLPRAQAQRLRVIELGTELFALGEPHPESERALVKALVIRADGSILTPGAPSDSAPRVAEQPLHVSDDDEERYSARRAQVTERPPGSSQTPVSSFTVFASEDIEIFPRLILSPLAVFDADAPAEPMLSLADQAPVRFDLVFQRGFPLVVLVHANGVGEPVARYTWDPFELSFMGPASDRLVDGSVFAMDLDGSPSLVPVGGLIESPRHENTPPPEMQQPDEQPPF
ncbi:MAG: hypothetical protein IPM64_06325 [Phycisphaerales bacterium]|nr:hypothetical protein [Phycisphaerales bacterium]